MRTGKKQIAEFRLAHRQIPKVDIFNIGAAPRLSYGRVFGASARTHELFADAELTGCEIRPILDGNGESESGAYQVSVVGSTQGAITVRATLDHERACDLCGYHFGSLPDPPAWHREFPPEYFSQLDFQTGDRLQIAGSSKVFIGGESVPLFVSGRVIELIRRNRLTGLDLMSREVEFCPVALAPT